MLTTDAVGGVWRYSLDLARGLSERNIPTIFAVLGPKADQAQQTEAKSIPALELVNTGLPLDWTAATPTDLAYASTRLATLATLMGAQAIHLHAPALVGAARWPAPVVAVAHSCVGTWWRAVRTGPIPPDLAWRAEATKAGLFRAAAVIAPTAAHAAALRDIYGSLTIQIVHNGANPLPLPSVQRDRAVLTAGRLWDEGKGMAALDRAAATLGAPIRAAGPIAGPNGARAEFEHLQLLGNLDRDGIARAYASASVFASMAAYEPFGLAVLEAAQAGMRLVLSDTPGFRELWDGAATFSDEPGLTAALHAALDAGNDGGARERAGRYTIDAMVDATITVHRACQRTL